MAETPLNCDYKIFAGVLLICAAAATALAAAGKAEPPFEFDVPFASQTRGIAGGSTFGVILLKPGTERMAVSRSVLDALQQLQFSPTATSIGTNDILPADHENTFDIVPLSDDLINAYNASERHLKLPVDRQYGLQYSLRYTVKNNSLHYEVHAVLYQRGLASSDWILFKKDTPASFLANI